MTKNAYDKTETKVAPHKHTDQHKAPVAADGERKTGHMTDQHNSREGDQTHGGPQATEEAHIHTCAERQRYRDTEMHRDIYRETETGTETETATATETETDTDTARQTDSHTDRQADRWTGGQTDR